jgi:hypothetical protein
MDLATIGPLVLGALGALGFIGKYLTGQAARDRAENRKLRAIDGDAWMFRVQRIARQRGIPLDPLPESWEAFHAGDEEQHGAASARGRAPALGADEGPGEGARPSRHALRDGG